MFVFHLSATWDISLRMIGRDAKGCKGGFTAGVSSACIERRSVNGVEYAPCEHSVGCQERSGIRVVASFNSAYA